MKFVDEASIHIIAGKGGNGSASFRREKFIQYGGPDGGDGGDGGGVYLEGDSGLNTLVDFRHRRMYKAENGVQGKGQEKYGKRGEDVYIRVPLGTIVADAESGVALGDVTEHGQHLLVARGGKGGLGNVHFKSSTNRSPKKFTPGLPGEDIKLQLEMKVLADVGLLGFPNAGKSTLISTVSAARPKVADYPFTTLYPNLGVVRVGLDSSFVIADVPWADRRRGRRGRSWCAISQAPAENTPVTAPGRSLHPWTRCHQRMQLASWNRNYSTLMPAWVTSCVGWCLPKSDILSEEEVAEITTRVVKELDWQEPWFVISSVARKGTDELVQSVGRALDEMTELEVEQQKVWVLESDSEI